MAFFGMAPISDFNKISCPVCEFERQNCGNPVNISNSIFTCTTCNSKWREIADLDRDKNPKIKNRLSTNAWKSSILSDGSLIPAVLTIVAAISAIAYFSNLPELSDNLISHNEIKQELTIHDLIIRTHDTSRSTAWMITAKIRNSANFPLHIPNIHIQAGTPGNRGYISHLYKPALQILEPGGNFKIRVALAKSHLPISEVTLAFSKLPNSGY